MSNFRLDRFLERLTSEQVFWGALTAGVVVLTLTLLVMMWTRWGQSQPLRKCLFLSAFTHLLLALYASSIQWSLATNEPPGEEENVVQVSAIDFELPAEDTAALDLPATESAPGEPPTAAAEPEPIAEAAARAAAGEPAPAERLAAGPLPAVPDELPVPELPEAEPTLSDAAEVPWEIAPESDPRAAAEPLATVEAPLAEARAEPAPPSPPAPLEREREVSETPAAPSPEVSPRDVSEAPPLEIPSDVPRLAEAPLTPEPAPALPGATDTAATAPPPAAPIVDIEVFDRLEPFAPAPEVGTVLSPPGEAPRPVPGELPAMRAPQLAGALPSPAPLAPGVPALESAPLPVPGAPVGVPVPYRERVLPDRRRLVQERGGSAQTEAAVDAALAWLAANQSPDGRWDAQRFGAGSGVGPDGQDRGRAGLKADSGMTGLALLAFLGAGHTHTAGPYRENVRRGIEFLLSRQAGDGSLGGQADSFAFMYCHGMAGIALSEAFALSGDRRLEPAVRRAVGYTLSMQNPTTGGWRYQRGDLGDTSQLGWQLMLLKSAQLGGVELPASARDGAIRFLRTVASGTHQGLASYRPRERATVSMTAEALFCRQLLGLARQNPASDEAGDFILGELPGSGRRNLYYWYYATLAMFQLQGEHWERWNSALQQELVATQLAKGPLAGSWDPNDVWGGYGGRVYSTAMGALCLEVYYRYLPLYGVATKPGPSRQ